MYGGGPDIYKPTYRTMLDKPIGKEDDLLHVCGFILIYNIYGYYLI